MSGFHHELSTPEATLSRPMAVARAAGLTTSKVPAHRLARYLPVPRPDRARGARSDARHHAELESEDHPQTPERPHAQGHGQRPPQRPALAVQPATLGTVRLAQQ